MTKLTKAPIELRPVRSTLETKPQTKPAQLSLETLPETPMLDETGTTVKKS